MKRKLIEEIIKNKMENPEMYPCKCECKRVCHGCIGCGFYSIDRNCHS